MKNLTTGSPNVFHFSGYYDINKFNSGSVISNEVFFQNRRPTNKDWLIVQRINLEDLDRKEVGKTNFWCWQQGCMAQFYDDKVIYNGSFQNKPVTMLNEEIIATTPYYAIHPKKRLFLTLNFGRLYDCRPGYGYAIEDQNKNVNIPDNDGVFIFDLDDGKRDLLISIKSLVDYLGLDNNRKYWNNHIKFNPSGTLFTFKLRCMNNGLETYSFVSDLQGNFSFMHSSTSHVYWIDDERLIFFDYKNKGTYIKNITSGNQNNFGVNFDSHWHCKNGIVYYEKTTDNTFSVFKKEIYIMHDTGEVFISDQPTLLFEGKNSSRKNEFRCDLHLVWNDEQIIFDSDQDGGRQIYLWK